MKRLKNKFYHVGYLDHNSCCHEAKVFYFICSDITLAFLFVTCIYCTLKYSCVFVSFASKMHFSRKCDHCRLPNCN